MTLDQYRRQERRDLWRYPLRLTSSQRRTLLLELWSLIRLKEDYSFGSDNCAAKIALLFANVTQDSTLYTQLPWPRAPLELILLLSQKNYLGSPRYLPNPQKRWRGIQALKTTEAADDRLQLEQTLIEVELSPTSDLSKMKADKRAILLKKLALTSMVPFTQSTRQIMLSENSAPHTASAYPELKIGVKWDQNSLPMTLTSSSWEPLSLTFQGRWRGQGFDDRLGYGQIADREWRILQLSTRVWPQSSTTHSLNQQNQTRLSLDQLILLAVKQRTLNDFGAWSWDVSLSYEQGLLAQYLLGKTWGTQPLIIDSASLSQHSTSQQSKPHQSPLSHDLSQLFSWQPSFIPNMKTDFTPSPISSSQWRISLLAGSTLAPCHQRFPRAQNKYFGACKRSFSPLSFDAILHVRGVIPFSFLYLYADLRGYTQTIAQGTHPFSIHREYRIGHQLTLSIHPPTSSVSSLNGLSLYTQIEQTVSFTQNNTEHNVLMSPTFINPLWNTFSLGVHINR